MTTLKYIPGACKQIYFEGGLTAEELATNWLVVTLTFKTVIEAATELTGIRH